VSQFGSIIGKSLADLSSKVTRIMAAMVAVGTVETVDASAGTVRIRMLMTDDDGTRLLSRPMPWFQRSTEHRPPNVGDHVFILDPSLGRGGAVAICGWPSLARPPVDGGGAAHTLYSGPAQVRVQSTDVRFGQDPTDFPALASRVLSELQSVRTDLAGFKSTFDAHVHVVTGAMPAGAAPVSASPTLTPAPAPHTPQSVAAQHVRVS
jgi:hypothetical protein